MACGVGFFFSSHGDFPCADLAQSPQEPLMELGPYSNSGFHAMLRWVSRSAKLSQNGANSALNTHLGKTNTYNSDLSFSPSTHISHFVPGSHTYSLNEPNLSQQDPAPALAMLVWYKLGC